MITSVMEVGGMASRRAEWLVNKTQKHVGTPCAGKLACTVWSGGKDGDNIKILPIAIQQ